MKMHQSKSKFGLPEAGFPQGVDLAAEARKARHRLYPVTALYTASAAGVLGTALLLSPRPMAAVAWFASGVFTWTYLEYFAHKYVLHGRFPDGPGWLRHQLHRMFDHLHFEHHARPWDGNHINGTVRDTLPAVLLLAVPSYLAPLHTAPVFVAGIIQSYILEEWVHHSVHFYKFRNRYFRYIRKHHLYHHSPHGAEVAYGLTNGLWDVLTGTRIPAPERLKLYGH
jgi:sterol desaturase/sphingolipid hydroxylase (fatty acid hydroxylase superfamily)